MKKGSKLPRHRAYLLRLWETRSLPPDPQTRWRFYLENLRGTDEHKFSDLDALTDFLRAELDEDGDASQLEDEGGAAMGSTDMTYLEGEAFELGFDPADVTILLVEEDDAIRDAIARWLSERLAEATIIAAEGDQAAEAVARERSPDVILIDVAPPKANSVDSVRRLRAACADAEIIALTMEEAKPRRDAVMEAGAGTCVKMWEMRQRLLPVLNQLLKGGEKDDSRKTVVCIEDEIDMLSLIKFTLERHNIELVTALGGEEGIRAVEETNPDLILLDLMMPGIDGVEVYKSLREREETRGIPVVVLTVLDPHWVESRGMDLAGVADYVTKPFAPQDLVHRVGRAMELVA